MTEDPIIIDSEDVPGAPESGAPEAVEPELVDSEPDVGSPAEPEPPLHEVMGSILSDTGDLEGLPDLYDDSGLPPAEEDWEALPDSPLLEGEHEPLTEDDEIARLDEDSFIVEELGPVTAQPAIQSYHIQARTREDEPWETVTYADPSKEMLEVADLPVGETWEFRVRTIFTNGEASAWSAPSPVIFPEDMIAPGAPSAPIVAGSTAGITVTWDGLDEDGRPMPADFARVIIWESRTGTDGTFERRASIPGAMDAILTGSYEVHDEYFYALTAMDRSGNESGFSKIASAKRLPLTDVTELKEELEQLHQTDAELEGAQQDLDRAFGDMAERQQEGEGRLDGAEERLAIAEAIIEPMPEQLEEAQASAREARAAAEAAEARAVDAMSFVSTVLQNGSFEEGLTNWTTSGGAGLADDITRSGVLAGLLPERGDSLTYDETLTAAAGQIWELSGYYYCGTDPQVGITFTYYDENGTALETVSEIELAGRVGVWNSFGPFRIEAPENSATMGFTIESVTDTGYVRVDDIALRDVTDVVRLEEAARAAVDQATAAQEKADRIEEAINGKGGLEERLEAARSLIDYNHDKTLEAIERAKSQLTNLVPSGDFEGVLEESRRITNSYAWRWSFHETDDAYRGKQVLRYEHEAANQAAFEPLELDVTPGRTYRVRFAVKIAEGAAGAGSGGFGQRWLRDDGTILNSSIHYAAWGPENFSSKLSGDWTIIEGDTTAPEGVYRMYPRFYLYGSTVEVGSVVYFDDLTITDVTDLKALEALAEEAAETAFVDKLVVRDGVVTPDAVIDRLYSDVVQANYATIEEDLVVKGNLFANNADLVTAAIKNLDVTEQSNFNDAFAKKLQADEFTARSAEIAQLTVASANLIPGMSQILESTPPPFKSGFGRNSGHPSIWIRSGDNSHGSAEQDTSADPDSLIPLSGGELYRFRVGVSASVAGSTAYMALLDESGSRVEITRNGSTSSYLLVNHEAGSTATRPNYYEAEFSPPATGRYRLRFYANHANGAPNPGSYQWFHGLEISRKLDGRILLDGTLQSRHIENTGDILTDALKARKIKGVDIDGDTFVGNTFRGGLFEGAVVTGGTVQTHSAPSRGIKLSNGSLGVYNDAGERMVHINGSTGDLDMKRGTLEAFDIVGGELKIGNRYTNPLLSRAGVWIDEHGRFLSYGLNGDLETLIDGRGGNRFTGQIQTSDDTPNSVTISPRIRRGRPGVEMGTGGGQQVQPSMQSMGSGSNDGFPASSLIIGGAEKAVNSSGRSDLVLKEGGDFELKQNWGTSSGLGLFKDGEYVSIRGRYRSTYKHSDQVVSGQVSMNASSSDTVRRSLTYGSPVPSGYRAVIATPTHSDPAGFHRAKIAVNQETASAHRVTIGDVSERSSEWGYNYWAVWR